MVTSSRDHSSKGVEVLSAFVLKVSDDIVPMKEDEVEKLFFRSAIEEATPPDSLYRFVFTQIELISVWLVFVCVSSD